MRQHGSPPNRPSHWSDLPLIQLQGEILGGLLLSYIKYPFILGGDIAGTVVEVGPRAERLKVNDRVVAAALAIAQASANPVEGAFQKYTIVREHISSPLPDGISFERACVLPLALSTAAYGLYHPDFLALDMPILRQRKNERNRVVIITGGPSRVGANAIQLAVSSGYDVVSTSLPKNFEFVKKLGAQYVFDYSSKTLANDLLVAVQGRELAGAYAIGDGAVEVCSTVLSRHPNTTHKFIAMAGGSPLGDQLQASTGKAILIITLLWKMLKQAIVSLFTGMKVKFIDLKDACEPNGHVARIYKEFLPRALAEGQFVLAPDPVVVGYGLDKI